MKSSWCCVKVEIKKMSERTRTRCPLLGKLHGISFSNVPSVPTFTLLYFVYPIPLPLGVKLPHTLHLSLSILSSLYMYPVTCRMEEWTGIYDLTVLTLSNSFSLLRRFHSGNLRKLGLTLYYFRRSIPAPNHLGYTRRHRTLSTISSRLRQGIRSTLRHSITSHSSYPNPRWRTETLE